MFIRSKIIKDNRGKETIYYQIVKSIQTSKGNRQKVVKHLGTAEKILEVFNNYEGSLNKATIKTKEKKSEEIQQTKEQLKGMLQNVKDGLDKFFRIE